ncbi:MAG: DUF192 domain-containing protein [Candidatus Sungbacteria bacterium]|nr:DUF192 domain-containing protein [Candidatus Sungbacteria bacterium]
MNDKIKSYIGYLVGTAVVVGALFWFVSAHMPSLSAAPVSAVPPVSRENRMPDQAIPSVQIAATKIEIEIATTTAAQQKGLSGRNSLPADRGMLFVFSRPAAYRFWMPDMRFPIDIIWINDNKIVDADEDVSPRFDPAHPVFYTPARLVQYVLEVNAGFMKRNKLHAGDPVSFHLMR